MSDQRNFPAFGNFAFARENDDGVYQLRRQISPALLASIGETTPPPRPLTNPTVGLLLQAIIVPGERTSEGTLIQAVSLPWFDIIEQLKNEWNLAYQIPPERWEEIIAGVYKRAGFDEVTLTPRSGDHGRDVIAVKKGVGQVRVIDQVKAYKPTLLVKANDVRALIGVLQTDGAAKGFVTTTSDFAPKIATDPTITPFIPSRLDLINGKTLLLRLEELARQGRPRP
jgi:restriction system protein